MNTDFELSAVTLVNEQGLLPRRTPLYPYCSKCRLEFARESPMIHEGRLAHPLSQVVAQTKASIAIAREVHRDIHVLRWIRRHQFRHL